MPKLSESTMTVELDPFIRDFFTRSIYAKWTETYENLKHFKALVYQPKIHGDKVGYENLKKERIEFFTKELEVWTKYKLMYSSVSPLVQQMNGE